MIKMSLAWTSLYICFYVQLKDACSKNKPLYSFFKCRITVGSTITSWWLSTTRTQARTGWRKNSRLPCCLHLNENYILEITLNSYSKYLLISHVLIFVGIQLVSEFKILKYTVKWLRFHLKELVNWDFIKKSNNNFVE